MVALKISLCNELLPLPWHESVEKIVELGFEGVEVAPYTFAPDVRVICKHERSRILEIARSHGLEICGLHWLLVSPPGLSLVHPDFSVRDRTVEYLGELARLCADLEGKVMVLGSPKQRSTLPGQRRESAWTFLIDSVKRACRYAEDCGVVIAIEPLARSLTDVVNTVSEALQVLERVGSPYLRINLDVFSMSDEAREYSEIIEEAGQYLVHFHANDTNGLAPGMGSADYNDIIRALRKVGYDSWLSVEVLSPVEDPVGVAKTGIQNLRSFLSTS